MVDGYALIWHQVSVKDGKCYHSTRSKHEGSSKLDPSMRPSDCLNFLPELAA